RAGRGDRGGLGARCRTHCGTTTKLGDEDVLPGTWRPLSSFRRMARGTLVTAQSSGGAPMDRIVVPASAARRARIRTGQQFRITTPEGCQCVDFWAIRADDLTEWASAEFTRVELMRLFPRVG